MGKNKQTSRVNVEIIINDSNDFVNKGFQNTNRAKSYSITQPFIVDKIPFFEHVLKMINDLQKDSINVFIPGIGNGPFFNYLLSNHSQINCKILNIYCADISKEMINSFLCYNGVLLQNSTKFIINLKIFSGANLVSLSDQFYTFLENGPELFDIILSSQFEHYFPNSKKSILYQRLSSIGSEVMIKDEFRSYLKTKLAIGGVYVTIDDFMFADSTEDERNLLNWDKYVLKNLTDPTIINKILSIDLKVGEKIIKYYSENNSEKELLQKIASRRNYRRQICLEERELFESALNSFIAIFGNKGTKYFIHPLKDYLNNFRMIIGQNS